MKTQLNLRVDELTTLRLEKIQKMTGQSKTEIVSNAIGKYYELVRKEMNKMVRQYNNHTKIIEGGGTDTELEVCKQIGNINRYMQGVYDVIDEITEYLPNKQDWFINHGEATHSQNPEPPISVRGNNPILMGFVRVRSGDPHYPIWLYTPDS